jgi:hypothetical protein
MTSDVSGDDAQAAGVRRDELRVHKPDLEVRRSQGTVIGDKAHVSQHFVQHFYGEREPVSWPVRVGRPPPVAEAFQPRTGLRARIDAPLSSANEAGAVTLVLAGDGGRGKTQLALVTYRRLATPALDLAMWVSATTRDNIVSAYGQGALAVGVAAVEDAEERAEAFLNWLAATERQWLVVLDDVAEPNDLKGLWPEGANGRVLVTSRRRDAAITTGMTRSLIDIGVYSPAEASAYLQARLDDVLGIPEDALTEAPELAADLGYLPVAVGQAATIIADEAITCAEFRRRLTDRTHRLDDLFPRPVADHQREALAATWSLALQRADLLAPVGLAQRLAVLIATLDPNGLPEPVLATQAARTFLSPDEIEGGAPAGVSPGQVHRALRNLHSLSVVTHEIEDGLSMVRMHALAQRAVLEGCDPALRPRAIRAAADALLEAWPDVDTRTPWGKSCARTPLPCTPSPPTCSGPPDHTQSSSARAAALARPDSLPTP